MWQPVSSDTDCWGGRGGGREGRREGGREREGRGGMERKKEIIHDTYVYV